MRLISCYIEGFGKLRGETYDFKEGVTSIFKKNGFGKTTLAAFIKAMFYGMEGYTKNSTKFCERKHFCPFGGGKFGGNLTFLWNGKTYRIERYFGEMKGETLKVYCGGDLTEELGDEIGKTVFGVDEEAFLRTAFIGSKEIEIQSTSSINAKLSHFLQGVDEEFDLEQAANALEKARKLYDSDRRSKVANNLVRKQEEIIDELRIDISNARAIQGRLEEKYARLAVLKSEVASLQKKLVTAMEENTRILLAEQYESMLARIAKLEAERAELEARYLLGLPTESEAAELGKRLDKESTLQAKASTMDFSVKDEEKLARIEESFARGVPTEEALYKAEQDIALLTSLQTQIQSDEGKTPNERERRLLQKFAHGTPTDEQLAAAEESVERYKTAKKEYEETPAWTVAPPAEGKKRSVGKYILTAVLALLLCAGGAALLALVNPVVGGVVLALGGVVLLADGFLYLNGKSTAQGVPMSAMNAEKQQKENALREAEDKAKSVLLPYGYCSGNGVAYDFAEMQKDLLEYGQYLAQEAERNRLLAEKRAQKTALEEGLTAFFRGYGLSGDNFIKLLSDLRGMVGDYFDLRDRKQSLGKGKVELESELNEHQAWIEGFRRKYGLATLHAGEVLEDLKSHARLSKEIERSKAEAADFKAKKGLTDSETEERVDLASLQAELEEKRKDLGKLEREIESDEVEAERLEKSESKLDEAEKRKNEYKRTYKLLTAAKDFLSQADENLKNRYVKPILDEFLRYAQIIREAIGEKVEMSKDFEVSFERNGEYRSERHLSAGQRSVVALCFRLALIKNMYEGNPPFLILDDPFTALDEEYMEKVRKVLLELSKEMQMVYFTCHESRVI